MRQWSFISGGSSGGSGISIYANTAALPATGTDGLIVSVLSNRKFYAWNASKSKWVVVAGEGTFLGRVNQSSIGSGAQTLAVVFSEVMPSINYSLLATIRNVTDADPIMLQIVSTVRATTGFTVTFNAPTDTANYVLEWAVSEDAPEEFP